MNYYISDLHVNHGENIIRFDNRPFTSSEEMDETLITNWNKTVTNADNVYILGDLIWSKDPDDWNKLLAKLKGKKYLILGNHDEEMLKIGKTNSILSLVEKYVDVSEHPDENNNILIKNNTISLIVDGKTLLLKHFNPLDLKSQIKQIPYGKNVFLNKNSPFSPLEADRDENKHIWKDEYTEINFPKFVFVVLLAFIVTDTIPSVLDLLFIYVNAYIETIPYNEFSDDDKRHSFYSDDIFVRTTNDHERLDKITRFENQSLTNILIRFKDNYYKNYTHGLPFNEFTMEHLACRIYKAYGSIIRDIFNAFYISSFGLETSYSLKNDLNGVDLSVEEVPIYSFIKSKSGCAFHEIKKDDRHELKFGIRLIANLSNSTSGIYLVTDDAVNEIIDIVKNKTIDKSLDKFYNVEF